MSSRSMDSAKIARWKLSFWWCAVVHWSDACCLKHANEISPLCMMFRYVFIFYLKRFLLSLHYGVLFLIFECFFLSRKIEIQQPSPLSLCLAKQYWLWHEVFYYLFFFTLTDMLKWLLCMWMPFQGITWKWDFSFA